MSIRSLGAVLLFLATAAVPGPESARAQERDQEAIRHEVTVTLRLLQVYVVDKGGKPVTDLRLEDFEIWDDGKPVTLTEFEAHSVSLEPEPGAEPAAEAPAAPAPGKMPRKFYLFFDFAFNSGPGIVKSREAALHFLDTRIKADDEVGVMSYHARRGLTINSFLSTDHGKIRAIVEKIKPSALTGRAADIGDESLRNEAELLAGAGAGDAAAVLMESERGLQEIQTGDYIQSLTDLAQSVRYVPGIKNVLLFSSGIANLLLTGTSGDFAARRTDTGNIRIRESYESMCKALADANCSVYPMNVKGLGSTLGRSGGRELLGDYSLKRLADESGGKYFDNVRNYENNVAVIQDLTAAYYVLGYAVHETQDGGFHRIKVKVKRPGCEVHGQSGYFNPKPFTDYTSNEKALHLIDLALSEKPRLQEPGGLAVDVLPYARGEKTEAAVVAGIPAGDLADAAEGKMEFVAIAFTATNDIAVLKREKLPRLENVPVRAYAESLVSLPPGDYDVRAVLRNTKTGEGSRGSRRITIPETAESGPLVLLPPLLLAAGGDAVRLGAGNSRKDKPLWDVYPYDPKAFAPVLGGAVKASAGIVAVVPCLDPPADLNAVEFAVSALAAGSTDEAPVKVASATWSGSGTRRLASLKIDATGLAPGEYDLRISAAAPGLERRTVSAGTVKIE